MEFFFLCSDACFDVLKVALLGLKLGLGVASALSALRRIRARRGPYLFEGTGMLGSPFF